MSPKAAKADAKLDDDIPVLVAPQCEVAPGPRCLAPFNLAGAAMTSALVTTRQRATWVTRAGRDPAGKATGSAAVGARHQVPRQL